ncbi:hypothetical protein C8R43DRAFT_870738, partial [Mycena crocata]
ARRPGLGNELLPSIYRLHVPVDRCVLLWTSPHSLTSHLAVRSAGVSSQLEALIYDKLLLTTVVEMREAYGVGLLRYHQYCDREGVGEHVRMLADRFLLAAFVAEAIGSCTGKCIRNWLSGLRLWHLFNNAEWHGDEGWLPALKKAGDKAGVPFKRPPHGPITPAHLHAWRASLDLSSPVGAASWSAALSGFWGCRCLGELLIHSAAKFSPERDTCHSTRVSCSVANRWQVTKTMGTLGGECIFTETAGANADLCPVWAWDNHMHVNHSPPPHTPLFVYRSETGWKHLTKDVFLKSLGTVIREASLEGIFGHSFRISGSLELLAAGVEPEVVMKIGGWTSLCFLIYWRRLEKILPLAITRAWDAHIRQFAAAHGHSLDISDLEIAE